MEASIFFIGMGILGSVVGSFAGASVWRLRARQLIEDKKRKEPIDSSELRRLRPLAEQRISNDRSRCLDCGHELAWYDLVPLLSWASTGGRCRYCQQPIGRFEPAIEVATAAFFLSFALYWWSNYDLADTWGVFGVWLGVLVCTVILFVYDLKWFLLPDRVMWPFIAFSTAIGAVAVVSSAQPLVELVSVLAGIVILSGLYLALWFGSRGAWVGFGDVKLGLGLALLLADWRLAFLTLFLANAIGTLVVLPGLLTGKVSKKAHIPFGPLLIIGAFISLYFGDAIIQQFYLLSSMALMLY